MILTCFWTEAKLMYNIWGLNWNELKDNLGSPPKQVHILCGDSRPVYNITPDIIYSAPLNRGPNGELLPDNATRRPFKPRLRGALVFLFQLSIKYYATSYYRLLYYSYFMLQQVTTGYYRSLQVTTCYYRLLRVTTGYYRLLQVTTGYYRLLQVTTGYYRLLQITVNYYRLL